MKKGERARIFRRVGTRRRGLRRFAVLTLLTAQAVASMAAPGASAADSAASRPVASPEDANRLQPLTIGFLEDFVVFPGNLRLKAKIDTGAKSSSLDALNILPFKKDGADWVRFSVAGDLEEVWRFRLPVVRTVGIKRAGAPTLRRYVVELSVCLGPIQKKTEVNLINRSGMNYRMLIGRLFLAGDFLVDPGAAFVTSTTCAGR